MARGCHRPPDGTLDVVHSCASSVESGAAAGASLSLETAMTQRVQRCGRLQIELEEDAFCVCRFYGASRRSMSARIERSHMPTIIASTPSHHHHHPHTHTHTSACHSPNNRTCCRRNVHKAIAKKVESSKRILLPYLHLQSRPALQLCGRYCGGATIKTKNKCHPAKICAHATACRGTAKLVKLQMLASRLSRSIETLHVRRSQR